VHWNEEEVRSGIGENKNKEKRGKRGKGRTVGFGDDPRGHHLNWNQKIREGCGRRETF
jgi:hypothetical protein